MGMGDGHADDQALRHLLHAFEPHVVHRLFEACGNVLRWGRIVGRIGNIPAATDPYDNASEFSRLVLISGVAGHDHVDSAEEAAEFAERLRFPPLGSRSVFSGVSHFGFVPMSIATATEVLNRETLLAAMLETPIAIENVDAIAAVDYGHASVREAYRRTIAACRAHGKWAGMGGLYDPDIMAEHIAAGVQFVLAGTDLSFMLSSASQKTKQLRQPGRVGQN